MSFEIQHMEIDSEVFGRPTFSLTGITSATEVDEALERICSVSETSYTVCKIPLDNIALVHLALERGFVFLETQLRTLLHLKNAPVGNHERYGYVRVEDQGQLEEVLAIAGETIEHDRVSRDPILGPGRSGERYRRFLRQSFEAEDEEIWAVMSLSTRRLLTFRSHKEVGPSEVLLLNGGVHPDHKGSGLGVISSHYCFAQLREAGVQRAVSHISGANAPIINLEIGYCKFRVTNILAVLRHVR